MLYETTSGLKVIFLPKDVRIEYNKKFGFYQLSSESYKITSFPLLDSFNPLCPKNADFFAHLDPPTSRYAVTDDEIPPLEIPHPGSDDLPNPFIQREPNGVDWQLYNITPSGSLNMMSLPSDVRFGCENGSYTLFGCTLPASFKPLSKINADYFLPPRLEWVEINGRSCPVCSDIGTHTHKHEYDPVKDKIIIKKEF